MTLIAHLADLHLGYSHLGFRDSSGRNQRQVDFEKAAFLAADEIIRRKVDLVLVAGDLLHDTNMYPAALSGAVEFCRKINQAGIHIVAIGGNHDEAEAPGRYNGLRFLHAHAGLDLHLEQGEFDFLDLRIHTVSYRTLSRASRGSGTLTPFQFDLAKNNILLSHGYAPGDGVPRIPEGAEIEIPSEWLSDPRFSLVLLGHIHHHGEIAPHVFYSGSLERRNFGESRERPGFYLHEIQGEDISSESVFIDQLGDGSLPRKMFDIVLDTSDMTLRQLDKEIVRIFDSHEIEGSQMRIVLQGVSPELDRSRSTKDWEKEFKRRGGFFFEVSVQTKQVSELLSIEFATPPDDIAKGFVDFVRLQDPDNQDGALLTKAEEIMQEAKERLMAQESDS